LSAGAGTHAVRVRRRKAAARKRAWRWTLLAAAAVALAGLLVGLIYAGSTERIAAGVRVAGVDVGGLTIGDAQKLLQRRAARLAHVPVVFVSGNHRWKITPARLDVRVDWAAAVQAAQRRGDGFAPIRGLRRLKVRVFGADVSPPVQYWNTALAYQLSLFAREIDRPHRDAALVRHGLKVAVVPGQDGHVLDRTAASSVVLHALAWLSRRGPVELPVRVDSRTVTAGDLTKATEEARTALSAPVHLALGQTRYRLPRWKIAPLLQLPANGQHELRLGGPGERRYLDRLSHTVGRPPFDATWSVTTKGIRVVPARDGLLLERRQTEDALLAALLSPTNRVAKIFVKTVAPSRSTEQARSMGITGLVGGYETFYGGDPNRIHNVQLVSHLIDRTLIAPGATFSFNGTTGERNEAKGFLQAPVIINGELETGLGGGVCQVSTTVFNAAYEAGLGITDRTNHALYISHYPLGRDATVDYPDIDLKFVNDTPHWLLLRTFVGSSSLTVNLYGTPVDRRVETQTAPLTAAGPVPIRYVDDPDLLKGQKVVETSGSAPLQTSVHRRVYGRDGKVIHDDVWSSYYQGETRVVHVGTKVPPPPPPPAKPKTTTQPQGTETAPTQTTTTSTTTTPSPQR
jgi:vancomycin resistance protein YoaR